MNRLDPFHRHIRPGMRGVEIGAYHNPIAPKAAGFDTIVVDVFDQDTLRRLAASDPNIDDADIVRIEPVDIVGSAVDLGRLLADRDIRDLDFVVSSHNFEHLPDAVGFLRAVERVLGPRGALIMAIPDMRRCFDFFRPPSGSMALIDAHQRGRKRPTPLQELEFAVETCRFEPGLPLNGSFRAAYTRYLEQLRRENDVYRDVHCWTFTPTSFRLLIEDLRHLGLTGFAIEELVSLGGEFVVRLRPAAAGTSSDDAAYSRRRTALRLEIVRELADLDPAPPPFGPDPPVPAARTLRNLWRFLRRRPLG